MRWEFIANRKSQLKPKNREGQIVNHWVPHQPLKTVESLDLHGVLDAVLLCLDIWGAKKGSTLKLVTLHTVNDLINAHFQINASYPHKKRAPYAVKIVLEAPL